MTAWTLVLLALAQGAEGTPARVVVCPGDYGGHLQGLATDADLNIYWSFTVQLVKTDREGGLLKVVDVPTHHGDLAWVDGKVYVAVNLGRFNEEPGQADSWVYVYDAEDLSLLAKHPVQEAVHGAGGMDHRDGAFFVVGGLPEDYGENYVYEYDGDFRFVKRHVVASGHTHLGIQTAAWLDGNWWFGCYEDRLGLLQTDADFQVLGRHDPSFALGIAAWEDGQCLLGASPRTPDGKRHTGTATITRLPGRSW